MGKREDPVPGRASRAFDSHQRFESTDGGYALTTTDFESRVTGVETDGSAIRYRVTVSVPMLSSAVRETVGPAVENGWFETMELRLEDAVAATRHDVAVEEYDLERDDTDAVARYVFEWGNDDTAPEVAQTVIEFVEGTYLQSVVPGYEYREPVAGMLARARRSDSGDDDGGPLPL